MKDATEETAASSKARGDAPAERACLRCCTMFWSEGFGQRICARCKTSATWKSGISAGDGRARRR